MIDRYIHSKKKDNQLVYAFISMKVNESYEDKSDQTKLSEIKIFAPERIISTEILLSQGKVRRACSRLVQLGYLKSQLVQYRAQYCLTMKYFDKDILDAVDVDNLDNDISELFFRFNLGLEYNRISEENKMNIKNPFHIFFLQELYAKMNNDLVKCSDIIDLCSKEIYKYHYKKPSAQTLASEIRIRLNNETIQKKKVIPERLYKQPDPFLRRRYHLRKKGIDIFLLGDSADDPMEDDITVND